MTLQAVAKKYTLEEYFNLVEQTNERLEFHNGKIVPMAGGSIDHDQIIKMIGFLLELAAEKEENKFIVMGSNTKIYLPEIEQAVLSDGFVVASEPQVIHGKKKPQAVTNPTVIIEVLSESTAGYDRGDKFKKYQTLPSFIEYLLIDQDKPEIDRFIKTKAGWTLKTFKGLDSKLEIHSLKLELAMEKIYKYVDFIVDSEASPKSDS